MDMTTVRSAKRHFPYKHPTFGTKTRPKPARAWQQSVYYWWWAYLRRNESYLATCAAGGGGEMAQIYADFGDVRDDDFKAWWSRRGVHLFAEPAAEDTVRVIAEATTHVAQIRVIALVSRAPLGV